MNNARLLFGFHRRPLKVRPGLLTCPSYQPLTAETESIAQNGKRQTRYQSQNAMAVKENFPLADGGAAAHGSRADAIQMGQDCGSPG
jgi:hypothetical protein